MTADLHADARRTLSALPASATRDDFLAFVEAHPDAMVRACAAGHLTASALVIDAQATRALLMLHRRLGRWLQMGGHCEAGDGTLHEAAAREAREESGIEGLVLSAEPVNLDRHGLTCDGRALDHLDVQFVAVAPPGAVEVINEESLALRWFDLEQVPDDDAAVARLARAALERYR